MLTTVQVLKTYNMAWAAVLGTADLKCPKDVGLGCCY